MEKNTSRYKSDVQLSSFVRVHGVKGQQQGLYKATLEVPLVPYYEKIPPAFIELRTSTAQFALHSWQAMRLPVVLFSLPVSVHKTLETAHQQGVQKLTPSTPDQLTALERKGFARPQLSLWLKQEGVAQLPIQALVQHLVGFTLYDSHTSETEALGTIADYYPAYQPILKLTNEVLVPLHKDFVSHVNWDNQTLVMRLPAGLVALNQADQSN